MKREIYKVYKPDVLERPVKHIKGEGKSFKVIEDELLKNPIEEPGSDGDGRFVWTKNGTWMDEKSFDKMFVKPFNYDIAKKSDKAKIPLNKNAFPTKSEKEVNHLIRSANAGLSLKDRLSKANINERLELLYRKFKDFECYWVEDNQSHGIKVNTKRFSLKWREQSGQKMTYLNVITKTDNEIIVNSITYHREFVQLKDIEYSLTNNFKKYVQSLSSPDYELTDWKEKYMRGNNDGFITYKDSIIIWNKFGEKKNGNAYISKLIFANKE